MLIKKNGVSINLTESDLNRITNKVLVNESVIMKKTLEDLKGEAFVNKKGTVETTPEGLRINLDGVSSPIFVRNN